MEQLSVAKLIYLEGIKYSSYDSLLNNKLAILNFDLSAATLTIAACIQKNKGNETLDKKQTKYFPVLLDVLRDHCGYKNDYLIYRLKKLHNTRNSVQHGDENPGHSAVEQNKSLLREFFDDICDKIYDNAVSFESISLSKLLKSSNEQILIELVEGLITEQKYSRAFNLIIISFLYRYLLVEENRIPNSLLSYHNRFAYPSKKRKLEGNIDALQDQLLILYEGINDSLQLIALGEYYYKLTEILNREVPELNLDYPAQWLGLMTKTDNSIDKDRIERLYEELCTFFFETEKLIIKYNNLDAPLVYDVYVNNITNNSAKINYKIMSIRNIDELEIILNNEKIPNVNYAENKEYIQLTNLTSSTNYTCEIQATQEEGKYPLTRTDAQITFKTL